MTTTVEFSIQTVCKPGSVVDGHSSGTGFTTCLNATNPGGETGMFLPAYVAIAGRPPLFGLAPGGVYPANSVTGIAVRSYRTVSPLP